MSQLWSVSGAAGTGSYRTFFSTLTTPLAPSVATMLFYVGLAPTAPVGSNLPPNRVIAYGSFNGGLNVGVKASNSLRAFNSRSGPRVGMVSFLQQSAANGLWAYGNESRGNLP